MKHYILYTVALTSLAMPAMAQETYESANIATEDLNGTARYVGMGGAMEALGADISTIGSNPASIGLFRKSGVNITAGATSVSGSDAKVASQLNITNKKTPMSFDQIGFVYTNESSKGNFLNFAFNYHKSRNFNQILSHQAALDKASQNKVAYQKGALGNSWSGGYYILDYPNIKERKGFESENCAYESNCFSQMDYMMWNAFIVDSHPDDGGFYCYDGSDYLFARNQKGYISNFDINISGNYNDRIYWGVTIGFKDVNYSHEQVYRENILDAKGNDAGYINTYDYRKITGQGYYVSGGIIFRPIDASPLRIGLSISTPTFYELKSSNHTELTNNGYDENLGLVIGTSDNSWSDFEHKYKVFTPWKFGASVGYTIGKQIALGASYDYSDYSAIDNRIITGYNYDYYSGTSEAESKSDDIMNRHTENTLLGVSTFKVGAEFRPMPELAIRAGYNYVSPMYETNGKRTTCLNTVGSYFSSTTDYVNWKATNRFTFGVGFNIDDFNIDVAYQRSMQNGDFHPFESFDEKTKMVNVHNVYNLAPATEVKNNRDQFLITLGYKF